MPDSPLIISLPPLDPLRRYTVRDACLYLSTSRVTFHKWLKAGTIKTISEGKRRYVPGSEIARLSSAPDVAPTPKKKIQMGALLAAMQKKS